MYIINNMWDNDDVKITKQVDGFSVLEYCRDLSVTQENAQISFYCSRMNVHKKQLICDLSQSPVTIQPGMMQMMVGDVKATTGLRGAGDFLKKSFRGMVTKESAIKPEYTGTGTLILEPTYKHIILLDMKDWHHGLVIDDCMFMACDSKIKQKLVARTNASSAILGNEGLFNLCFESNKGGVVALESNVAQEELITIELQDDVLKIDGNMAIAWSKSLEFTVERSGSTLAGSVASKEGLVNVYRGTGRVLVSPVQKTIPVVEHNEMEEM